MKTYKIKATFTEPILGTVPKNKDVYATYIQGKALKEGVELTEDQQDDELSSITETEEKGWTGFHELDEVPFLFDYVLKGFAKDACGSLRRASGTESKKFTAHKKKIDGLMFIEPRKIPLQLPPNSEMGVLERPLRAQTAQGERVTLARSDTCPPGTVIEFEIIIIGGIPKSLLLEWLDYGKYKGIGQWRNASYGRFTYEIA